MKLRHYFMSALSVYLLAGLIACSKQEDDNKTASVPLNPGMQTTCPAGSTLVPTANGYQMCSGPGGVLTTPIYTANPNYYPQTLSFSSDNYCYKSISVTNQAQFQKFLKEAMGVCDQNYSTGGNAGCSAWSSGYFKMQVQLASSTINNAQPQMATTFWAYPQQQGYYYSLPSFSDFFWGMIGFPVYNTYAYATRNPLSLTMNTYVVNSNQGFEGRSNGEMYTLANRSLIQIQVAVGKPTDTHFTYGVAYEGIVFMTGTLVNQQNYSYYCGY